MPGHDVAVAVIHGMGRQRKDPDAPSDRRTFSAGLHRKIAAELGAPAMERVAWREIFWADVVQSREDRFLARIDPGRVPWLREFVMHRLADAASYRWTIDGRHRIYREVNARVAAVMAELLEDTHPAAPVILIAHSLGGHILSNFTYDALKAEESPGFTAMGTLHSLITFGCNIPVFVVAYDPGDLTVIDPSVARRHCPGDPPWWVNFWDPADPLGFPLIPLGGGYGRMGGQLEDRRIRAGWGIPGLAHNAYWEDLDVWRCVAARLHRALA